MKMLLITILCSILISCNKKAEEKIIEETKNVETPIVNDVFNGNFVGCGYDVLRVDIIDDSKIFYSLEEFKGWNEKGTNYEDSLGINKELWEVKNGDSLQIRIFTSKENNTTLILKNRKQQKRASNYTAELTIKKGSKTIYNCSEFWNK